MKAACLAVLLMSLVVSAPGLCQSNELSKKEGATSASSVYTDLAPGKCKLIKFVKEGASSTRLCSGPAGYKLLTEDDDERVSVTVVTPGGKRHPLNFWQLITPHFSSLGKKAEWRITKKNGKLVPIALIVRVNAYEQPDTDKVTSYLAVAKITSETICVTDRIKPGPVSNVEAKRAADSAANKPCLAEPASAADVKVPGLK
jgi:hypothetical protein